MELQTINEVRDVAEVAGVRLTRTSLAFERTDAETFARARRFLAEVDKGARWWWGDYWCAWVNARMAQLEEGDADLRQEHAGDKRKWIARAAYEIRQAAEAMEIASEVSDQLAMWKTARFYNPSRRRDELSNGHHADAMEGTRGDEMAARMWLGKAADAGWSRSQLRAAMRAVVREEAIGEDVADGADEWDMEFVYGARRWARAHMDAADDIAPEVAGALLKELMPVVELLGKISQKAGKESIFTTPPRR